MAKRVLTPEEAKSLGLDAPTKKRVLDPAEVEALGLNKPTRVPSPSGWRDPGAEPTWNERVAQQERQNEAMFGAVSSGLHGAAQAMEGPINGALAMMTATPNKQNLDTYRAERDRVEAAQKENLERFPHAPMVGAVLAGAAGQAPTAAGRIAASGIQGATYGLGSSDADLTKGEFSKAAPGAVLGLVGGLAGGTAGEVLNAGAGLAARKLGSVLDKNRAGAQKAAEQAFRSARGAYGGEVSSASRTLELLEAAADGSLPNVDADLRAAAKVFIASPEGVALRNQVVRSSMGRAGDQMGRLQGARDAMMTAIEGQMPEAVDAAAQARLDDPSALARRLRELVPRLGLPAAGGAVAGPPGAAAGALTAAVLGRGSTMARNLLADPYVASRALGGSAAALSGGGNAVSKAAPSMLQPYLDLLEPDSE